MLKGEGGKQTNFKESVLMLIKRNLSVCLLAITFVVFLMLLISFLPQAFTRGQTYTAIVRQVGFLGCVALGLTLLVAAGEIDLSTGSVLLFSSYLFAVVFKSGGNPWLAMLIALSTGAALGFLNGIITTRFKLPSLLVTLGAMFVWRGAALVLSKGYTIHVREIRNTLFYSVFGGDVFGVPVQFIWSLIFFTIFYLILNYHKFGNWITCTGDNLEAARNMGIPVDRTKIICFTLVGLVSAFSGIMQVAYTSVFTSFMGGGETYLFPILTAVFMGGTPITGGAGSLTGTFISTFILSFLASGLISLGITGFATRIAYGSILIAILILNARALKRKF